jgi:RNA polymerase sigma-54 factor
LQEKTKFSEKKHIDSEKKDLNVCDNLNNTSDLLKKENKIDLENTFDTHLSSNSNLENKKLFDKEILKSGNSISAGEVIEKTLKNKTSLKEYLVNQINIEFNDKDFKEIAIGMIDYLHPSGWFTASINEVSEDLNINSSIIAKTLQKLKKLEPVGVFSENLADCLKVQLVEYNYYNEHYEILLKNLQLLPAGKFKQVSKLCKVTEKELFEMIKIVKKLNPKPAEQFEQDNIMIDQPDIIVSKSEKGWRIDLNRSTLPSVELDEGYIAEISSYNFDEKGNNFADEKLEKHDG